VSVLAVHTRIHTPATRSKFDDGPQMSLKSLIKLTVLDLWLSPMLHHGQKPTGRNGLHKHAVYY
jgi:hypothetical protein